MEALDQLYLEMLKRGFLVLRQACDAHDTAWINAEVELLHNVPSLINEANVLRHQYFWEQERDRYQVWMASYGSAQAKSRMNTYYVPVWNEMAPIITELLAAVPR